jgi:hypothetical protein
LSAADSRLFQEQVRTLLSSLSEDATVSFVHGMDYSAGVRPSPGPSPGAATLNSKRGLENRATPGQSGLAAPGDGQCH